MCSHHPPDTSAESKRQGKEPHAVTYAALPLLQNRTRQMLGQQHCLRMMDHLVNRAKCNYCMCPRFLTSVCMIYQLVSQIIFFINIPSTPQILFLIQKISRSNTAYVKLFQLMTNVIRLAIIMLLDNLKSWTKQVLFILLPSPKKKRCSSILFLFWNERV